ncbi:MAG: T9SS type A sorting domain-containing protein [Flavobacteriaceae bacterium]
MKKYSLILFFFLTATIGFSQDLYVSNNSFIYVDGTGFANYNATTNPNAAALFVTDDIQLAGTNSIIYLRNEAQLLQQSGGIVNSGLGYLEVEQDGTSNLYNYNYWGSPVQSAFNAFSLGSILYNGTDPNNVLGIQWSTAYDANYSTAPITMSSYWLYTFNDNQFDDYGTWEPISETTNVNVGLGFTMKGSGSGSATQNYMFRGIPNTGFIQNAISGGAQGTLVGNPYPSAIDGDEFIDDNVSALLDGTLVFWEQAPTNNSHYLSQYQGRYSYYNKTGGLPPTTPPEISGSGTASKTPQRYVAVGQGFFVRGDADGGTITFENDQRFFVKESSGNSIFFGPNNEVSETEITTGANNNSDNSIQRIRINFTSPEGAIRHLLLGFTTNNKATDAFDYGYDGLNSDDFPSDLTFLIQNDYYTIQGVGSFDAEKKYPLHLLLGENGNIEIALDELENFNQPIDVFVYDDWLRASTKLNEINYTAILDAGTYSDRYFLTFKDSSETLSDSENIASDFIIFQNNKTSQLTIVNPNNLVISSINLYDITGKLIFEHTDLPLKNKHEFSTKDFSEGVYLATLKTADNQTINKKLVITN